MILEQAPAKINLFLHVTGKRDDGYHLLSSLVTFSKTDYDTIHIEPADEFTFECTTKSLETDTNLVAKAAKAFSQLLDKPLNCKITLQKRLPVAGGVGGGSSDAAATIRGLEKFWSVLPPKPSINKGKAFDDMLVSLGADVPVCYFGQDCLMRGIGDIIEPLPHALPPFELEIWNPGVPLSTQEVFKGFDGSFAKDLRTEDLLAWDNAQQMCEWLKDNTINSLEPAAKAILSHNDTPIFETALFSRLSGSGPSLFFISDPAR